MNQGDMPLGRLKANITRSVSGGLKPPQFQKSPMLKPARAKIATAKIEHVGDDTASPTPEISDKPKLRPAPKGLKFRGSFKYGGPVKHTGVYLLHKGEHVKSPFNRRRG